MVVGEPLTATLCNCTTSPLKNSALFLRYIFSGYPLSILYQFPTYVGTNRPEDGKLVALPLDHTGAEFVILLHTNIPQIRLSRNSQMGHGNPRTHRVFQSRIHGIHNAVLDRRRRRAMRHHPHLSSIVDKWGASACITRVHHLYQLCKLMINTNCSASAGSRTTYTSRTCSTAKPTNQTVAGRGYVCTPS